METVYVMNGARVNITNFTSPDGYFFSGNILLGYPDKMAEYGISVIEITPPADFSPSTYWVERIDVSPFIRYTKKTDGEVAAERNMALQSQIDDLERNAILPRVTRDMHRMVTLQACAAQGITEQDLLTEGGAHYSPGYARFKAFDDTIAALRAQRI